ncbi:hypothetical protein H257_15946 [Aphanomyces astaci]|uniref:PUL domain-containing protein n=1 Tax=Aphanomyces astaci TaxID=112090 RepID=W4FKG2_APHAT|nr:hypothetical protein H257_15946 [Aphanomyces astaci]ETV67982.1 hypothetical protein H257_15946 [Aphanomyces astaci]|eukprot:XP_009842545.1 hypothetical protein H257_15946 [Aphanomyces astaci]
MVIPVEIETPSGVKKLEIGYNQGQNPFTVAQAFIDKHLLNPSYLKEIADYISDRSANYQPPLLGDHSTPSTEKATPLPPPTPPAPSSAYFPLKTFATFDTAKIAKLFATVDQFNTLYPVLTAEELTVVSSLISTLQQTSYYHSSVVTKIQVGVVCKLVGQWPSSHVFPALDLLRLVLVHPVGATHVPDTAASLVLGHAFAPDAADATRFLALRVLANWTPHAPSKVIALVPTVAEGINSAWPAISSWSKPLALSVATLWMDVVVALTTSGNLDENRAATIVATQLAELCMAIADEETLGRVLVAIGSLAVTFPSVGVAGISAAVLQDKASKFLPASAIHAIVSDVVAVLKTK